MGSRDGMSVYQSTEPDWQVVPITVGSGPAGGKEVTVPEAGRAMITGSGLLKDAIPGASDLYYVEKLSDSKIKVYRLFSLPMGQLTHKGHSVFPINSIYP
jgi:hypothetical protein